MQQMTSVQREAIRHTYKEVFPERLIMIHKKNDLTGQTVFSDRSSQVHCQATTLNLHL